MFQKTAVGVAARLDFQQNLDAALQGVDRLIEAVTRKCVGVAQRPDGQGVMQNGRQSMGCPDAPASSTRAFPALVEANARHVFGGRRQ
jgi:hypothetical protein